MNIETFTVVPDSWLNYGLSLTDLVILSYITGFDSDYYASQKQISEKYKLGTATVQRSIKKLKEKDFITKSENAYHSNVELTFEQFTMVPDLWLKYDLSITDLVILSYITSFKPKSCYVSQETIAKKYNVSKDTVKRSLKKLEERDFITRIVRGGNISNKYISKVSLPKSKNWRN